MPDTINKDKLLRFFKAAALGYDAMKDSENRERCLFIVELLQSEDFDFYD